MLNNNNNNIIDFSIMSVGAVVYLVQNHVLQEKLSRPVKKMDFVNFFFILIREHFAAGFKAFSQNYYYLLKLKYAFFKHYRK